MARKRAGSTGGQGTGSGKETAGTPRGYSIYSEKAEQAARPVAPDVPAEDDAALLRSVDDAVASGGIDPAEASEPPAPGASIFADAEEPKGPMTPEEVAREAAEDAELIAAVDEVSARETPGAPDAPVVSPATPDSEPLSGAGVASARVASERAAESEAVASEAAASEPVAASRPAAERRDYAPRSSREPEIASISPAAATAAARRSGGFAGKALGGILFLLAGGALALWLGPKLAPNLPQGMAPVANFLEPGREAAEGRLATLDSEIAALRERIANIPSGVTPDQVSSAVTGVKGEIDAELTQLRDQIGAGAGMAERLARIESAQQGAVAELASLKEQIAAGGAAAGAVAPPTDLYRGEIDGLRAEMGTLSDQVAGLSTRVDAVDAAAQRQVDTAQQTVETVQAEAAQAVDAAAREADVASVAAALAAGQPFAEPLARLEELPDANVPAGLSAAAQSGVLSIPALRDAFPEAAHAAIRASIVAGAGDGMLDRAYALVRAQVATRSLKPTEGSAPDAVLSRMEARLGDADLPGVLAEAEALPSEARAAMSDWLAQTKLRADADAGLSALESAAPATN